MLLDESLFEVWVVWSYLWPDVSARLPVSVIYCGSMTVVVKPKSAIGFC